MTLWMILAVLLLLTLPLGFVFAGVALALWLTWAIAAAIWGLLTWLIGDPVIAVVIALLIGIWIGRKQRPLPPA